MKFNEAKNILLGNGIQVKKVYLGERLIWSLFLELEPESIWINEDESVKVNVKSNTSWTVK